MLSNIPKQLLSFPKGIIVKIQIIEKGFTLNSSGYPIIGITLLRNQLPFRVFFLNNHYVHLTNQLEEISNKDQQQTQFPIVCVSNVLFVIH